MRKLVAAAAASSVCLALSVARVYVTGISNGGQAATALACVLDERIATISPVAGAVDFGDDCNPARPVPMLAFYGQEDPIALFEGGLAPFVAQSPTEVGAPLGDLPAAVAFTVPSIPPAGPCSKMSRAAGSGPAAGSTTATSSTASTRWPVRAPTRATSSHPS